MNSVRCYPLPLRIVRLSMALVCLSLYLFPRGIVAGLHVEPDPKATFNKLLPAFEKNLKAELETPDDFAGGTIRFELTGPATSDIDKWDATNNPYLVVTFPAKTTILRKEGTDKTDPAVRDVPMTASFLFIDGKWEFQFAGEEHFGNKAKKAFAAASGK